MLPRDSFFRAPRCLFLLVTYVLAIPDTETDGCMIADRYKCFAKGGNELAGIVAFIRDFRIGIDLKYE